jgi:hypothetical protein
MLRLQKKDKQSSKCQDKKRERERGLLLNFSFLFQTTIIARKIRRSELNYSE